MRPWTQAAPLGPVPHLRNGNKTSTRLSCTLWGRDATPCTDEGPGSEEGRSAADGRQVARFPAGLWAADRTSPDSRFLVFTSL